MPILILAALVVIVLMLYIALGGKEGAPTISLNKIFEFINPKPSAEDAAQDESAAASAAPEASATAEGAAPEGTAAAFKTAEAPAAAAAEASAAAGEQTETAADGAAFASMEELTEFYRKEAERLTGIKH
jgi:hypothetical protein